MCSCRALCPNSARLRQQIVHPRRLNHTAHPRAAEPMSALVPCSVITSCSAPAAGRRPSGPSRAPTEVPQHGRRKQQHVRPVFFRRANRYDRARQDVRLLRLVKHACLRLLARLMWTACLLWTAGPFYNCAHRRAQPHVPRGPRWRAPRSPGWGPWLAVTRSAKVFPGVVLSTTVSVSPHVRPSASRRPRLWAAGLAPG